MRPKPMCSSSNSKTIKEVKYAMNDKKLDQKILYFMEDIIVVEGSHKSKKTKDMDINEPCAFDRPKVVLIVEGFKELRYHIFINNENSSEVMIFI